MIGQKPMFYQSIKHRKNMFYCFSPHYLYIVKQMKKPKAVYYTVIKHSGHLRTLEKCRKHSPAARVVYISLVFSNARRVLSQCNTRLRLLYLLTKLPVHDFLPCLPYVSLPDKYSSVVYALRQTKLKHLCLQTPLQEIFNSKTQHVIEFHSVLIQNAYAYKTS